MADSLEDKARSGMFYAWLGIAHFMYGKSKDSYDYLLKGLDLGEGVCSQKVVGYSCSWLTWACAELGLFAEGIDHGKRAQKIAESFPSDPYLFFKSLSGICFIYFYIGDARRIFKGAKRLIEYAEKHANNRSKVFGHWMKGYGHWAAGDMKSSQKDSKKAIEVALDPFYSQFPIFTLGAAYFLSGQLQEAENVIQSGLNFTEKHGASLLSPGYQCFLSPILIAKGQMQQGIELMKKAQTVLISNQRRVNYAFSEYILGEIYSQIATGPKPSLSIMAKNFGFLVKNVPFATRKAEEHFKKAIELFNEIGMKGFFGQVNLSLGFLYKATKRTDQAKKCLLEATEIFRESEADGWLKKANEALDSLA
jgi:tetratricopeptide (TPR) repeat protein